MRINRASPIEQCIFTYALPLVFDLDSESPNPPPGPGDYTVTPRPTGGADQPSAEGDTQTLYYGLIGGGCALFLVLPVAFFLIRRRHHRKVMMELKGGKDVKDLSAAAGTALGSEDQLMGGTVGDLSSGESLNQP